jgi:hypothetical protein
VFVEGDHRILWGYLFEQYAQREAQYERDQSLRKSFRVHCARYIATFLRCHKSLGEEVDDRSPGPEGGCASKFRVGERCRANPWYTSMASRVTLSTGMNAAATARI